MQTRCPACQTLYRIDEDVLKRAGGQARCFRCDTVFDAYRNPAEDLAADEEETPYPGEDSEGLSELSALTDLPEVPSHSAVAPDSELDLDDLAESLRRYEPEPFGTLGADSSGSPRDEDAERAEEPLDLTGLPGLDDERLRDLDDGPDEPPALSAHATAPAAPTPVQPASHGATSMLAGGIAALLAILALAQLAWLNRDPVLATPQGQALAHAVCGVLDCDLPPRRAPSRYTVLERHIAPDPDHQGALLLRLSFRNGADFAQPLPDIQLSLYDSEEQLMARRRLHPHEYLFPAPSADTRVAAQEVVQVTVKLEDPGRHATGFKLEFL